MRFSTMNDKTTVYLDFFDHIKFEEKNFLNFKKKESFTFYAILIGIPVFSNIILVLLKEFLKFDPNVHVLEYLIIIDNFLFFLSIVLSFFYIYSKNNQIFKDHGFWFYVLYALIFPSIRIILNPIWNVIFENDSYFVNNFIDATTFIFNILLLVIFIVFLYKNSNLYKSMFHNLRDWKATGLSIAIVLFSLLIVFLLNLGLEQLSRNISSRDISQNQIAIQASLDKNVDVIFSKINLIFSTIIIAPIFEELLYRKILMNIGNNEAYTIFLSSFFFAFLHIRAFFDWAWIFPYLSLSIINAFLYWRFSAISMPILTHLFINVFGVLVLIGVVSLR